MRPARDLFKESLLAGGFKESKDILMRETPEAVHLVRLYTESPENLVDFFLEVSTRDGEVKAAGRCIARPSGTVDCSIRAVGDKSKIESLIRELLEKAASAAKVWGWVYGPEYYISRLQDLTGEAEGEKEQGETVRAATRA